MDFQHTMVCLFTLISLYNIIHHPICHISHYCTPKPKLTGASIMMNTFKHIIILQKHKERPNASKSTLIFMFCLLATQTSDIELNPGPTGRTQYPCGKCSENVTWSQKGILCDDCETWYHADCESIGNSTYVRLSDSRFSWHCRQCGSLNYSNSLSASLNSLSDTSLYAPLSNLNNNDSLNTVQSSFLQDDTPIPKATSTPNPQKRSRPIKTKLRYSERLTILNINCRSVKNKVPDLHLVIDQLKPDIICLTETWLKSDVSSSEVFPDNLNYSVCRDDRCDGKGGGVMIAISKSLSSQEQPDLKTNCNITWSKISLPGFRNIFVGAFYKPHELDDESLSELWLSLGKIPKDSIVWLLGDFNMPDINWVNETLKPNCKNRSLYENFMEKISHFNLEQMVKTPTRSSNILDLFLTTHPSHVHLVKTLPSLATSDHDIVFHEVNLNRGRPIQPRRTIKCFSKANWDGIKSDMQSFASKYFSEDHTNPDDAWNLLKDCLNESCSKHIPTKVTKSRADLPWLTPKIIRLIRKRDKLYNKLSKTSNPGQSKNLKSLKSYIQKQIRASYWSYLENVIFNHDSQPGRNKKFYSLIKHNKKENVGIAPLKSDGITHTDPVNKANILNKQFESVFSPPQPLSLKHLCSKLLTSPSTIMGNIHVTPDGVDKLLLGLSPHKASGPDEISPRILKVLHQELAPVLCHIFNLSLETGIVPKDWKKATVAPVFKKGLKCNPSNYRPISLTCIASKLLEHIVVSNLMSFFDKNNILSPFQHGFRSGHSCETQLINFTQELYTNLEQGHQTDVIVMDFSKAFDKVDHLRLIYKLQSVGVSPQVTNWVKSFLANRTQRVAVEGHLSSELPVLSGVPQGSVLGPCLFLIYINDLPDSVKCKTRMFADDTIVYLTVQSNNDCLSLQHDLHKLEKWERVWLMEFNPDKCEVLRVSRKKNPTIYPYRLHNTELKSTCSAKYLGITITKDLNWSQHIENITSKATSSLRFIQRNVKTDNVKVKEAAYTTYVRPQLEYCSSVWHPWQKSLVHKVECVQRSAARYVMNDYNYRSSVTEMLNTLNWKTLYYRRLNSSLIMFYKIRAHSVAVDPSYLIHTRNLNYLIPQSRTNYFANSYFPRTIRLWNSLPSTVKESPSLSIFTERLAVVNLQ